MTMQRMLISIFEIHFKEYAYTFSYAFSAEHNFGTQRYSYVPRKNRVDCAIVFHKDKYIRLSILCSISIPNISILIFYAISTYSISPKAKKKV